MHGYNPTVSESEQSQPGWEQQDCNLACLKCEPSDEHMLV